MTQALQFALLIAAAPILVFGLYQWTLAALSGLYALRSRPVMAPEQQQPLRFVVLVPAHNEELLIEQTVRSVLRSAYPRESFELIVVADNCTDRTAEIARAAGARCLERFDAERRGKPYALDWAIRQLDLNSFDALTIIDADTAVHPNYLSEMARRLRSGSVALQGYFGVLNPDQNWLTRLSLLPGILKFKMSFPGKALLGLSCPLAGNGMCFDISLIQRFGWNAFSITENWEYWVLLTLNRVRVDSAPTAVIYSQVAKSLSSGNSQRQRWMKGRIQTLIQYGPTLIKRAFRELNLEMFDAVLELAKPSHAIFLIWTLAYAVAAFVAWKLDPGSLYILQLAIGLVVAQVLYLLLGFAVGRPPLRTWFALAMAPWYMGWKLMISLKGLFSLSDRAWVRTKRH